MKLKWVVLLVAALLAPLLMGASCGSDDRSSQVNTFIIEGDRNTASVQICQHGDCTQSNTYGGYGGDRDGDGMIAAFASLTLCLAGVVVMAGIYIGVRSSYD